MTSFVCFSLQEISETTAEAPLLLFIRNSVFKLRKHCGGINNHCTKPDHDAC